MVDVNFVFLYDERVVVYATKTSWWIFHRTTCHSDYL